MEALWVCTLARDGRAQGDTARVHKDLDDKVLGHKMVPGDRVLAHMLLHGTVLGHMRVLDGVELGHMTVLGGTAQDLDGTVLVGSDHLKKVDPS